MKLLAIALLAACAHAVPPLPSNVTYTLAPYQCRIAAPPVIDVALAPEIELRWYLSRFQAWSIDLWLCVSKAHAIGSP